MKRAIAPLAYGLVVAALGGCGHYMVRSPDTGQTYYTRHINRSLGSKAITFRDIDTGAKVTLTDSEIMKLTPAEFEQGLDQRARAGAQSETDRLSALIR